MRLTAHEPWVYLRLRWGHFTVRCPDAGGEVVLAENYGDSLTGAFYDESEQYLDRAKADWHNKQGWCVISIIRTACHELDRKLLREFSEWIIPLRHLGVQFLPSLFEGCDKPD
jgi:hypothetical protein